MIFIFDDCALLALGSGNSRASWLVTSQDTEDTLVPLLCLLEAGQQRPGLTEHAGQLDMRFIELDYPALLAAENSGLPLPQGHALHVAHGVVDMPVMIATIEPSRYKNTCITVFDLNH